MGRKKNIALKIIKENIVYIVLLTLFLCIFIVIQMFFKQKIILIDETVMRFFEQNMISDANTAFMRYVTIFGEWYIPIALIVLLLIFLKNKKISIFMAINLAWAFFLCQFTKTLIARERPLSIFIENLSGYSFPSGHTMCSTAFYIFFYYFMQKQTRSVFLKGVFLVFTLTLVFFIGISRIYLSVHFLTDVIGGFILGLICVLMFINIYRKNFAEDQMEMKK